MSQQATELLGSSNAANCAGSTIGVADALQEKAPLSKISRIFLGAVPSQGQENTLSSGYFSILGRVSNLGVYVVSENKGTTPVRLELALRDFQLGFISLGRAAEIAGLKYDTFIDELRRRCIELEFGPETAEEAELEERRFLDRTRNAGTV